MKLGKKGMEQIIQIKLNPDEAGRTGQVGRRRTVQHREVETVETGRNRENDQRATLRVAFFFLGLLSLSCRQDDSAYRVISHCLHTLSSPSGDPYLYDAILTDEFGYAIYSSRSNATWRVLSTGGTSPGFSSITVFRTAPSCCATRPRSLIPSSLR